MLHEDPMQFHPQWKHAVHDTSTDRPGPERRAFSARPATRRDTADSARLNAIRERVRKGYYDTPGAVDELAARLLDGGEL